MFQRHMLTSAYLCLRCLPRLLPKRPHCASAWAQAGAAHFAPEQSCPLRVLECTAALGTSLPFTSSLQKRLDVLSSGLCCCNLLILMQACISIQLLLHSACNTCVHLCLHALRMARHYR